MCSSVSCYQIIKLCASPRYNCNSAEEELKSLTGSEKEHTYGPWQKNVSWNNSLQGTEDGELQFSGR